MNAHAHRARSLLFHFFFYIKPCGKEKTSHEKIPLMADLMIGVLRPAINGFPSPELDHDHVGLKAIKLKQEKETHAGTTIICSHLNVLSQENDENDCCPSGRHAVGRVPEEQAKGFRPTFLFTKKKENGGNDRSTGLKPTIITIFISFLKKKERTD